MGGGEMGPDSMRKAYKIAGELALGVNHFELKGSVYGG